MMDNWLEDVLREIESDITSVDSTNLSEQRSEQMSAQSSADRAAKLAAGLTPSELTSRTSNGDDPASKEDSYLSTPSSENSGDSVDDASSVTSDSEEQTTLSHVHTNHIHGSDSESVYSGRSASDLDDSGLSNS